MGVGVRGWGGGLGGGGEGGVCMGGGGRRMNSSFIHFVGRTVVIVKYFPCI